MAEGGTSRRVARYEKLVRQIASEFLIHGIHELEMGWVNVSRVQVSPDLRTARVFVNISNSENQEEDLEVLKRYAPELQKTIHAQVRSKYCPRVQFIIDPSFEKIMNVEKMFFEIERERKQREQLSEETSAEI